MQVRNNSPRRKFTDKELKALLPLESQKVIYILTTSGDRKAFWGMKRKLREDREAALRKLREDKGYISFRNKELTRVMNTGAIVMEVSRKWFDVGDFWERYSIAVRAIAEKMDRIALEGKRSIESFPNNYWMRVAHTALRSELTKKLNRMEREVSFCHIDGSDKDPEGDEYTPLYDLIIARIEVERIAERLGPEERSLFLLLLEEHDGYEAGMKLDFNHWKVDRLRARIKEIAREVSSEAPLNN
jgi:hypothetical protein